MAVLQGQAYWAKLDRASNTFDPSKPNWSIDVSVDSKNKKMMEELGIKTKNKGDDRGDFISLKKDQFLANGDELPKPRLLDAKKNDISGTLVGNGSSVKVSFYPKEWKYAGRTGVRPVLKDVQVLALVPYVPKDEFDEEEGYEGTPSSNSNNTAQDIDGNDLEFD